MALSKESVFEVEKLFAKRFPECGVAYEGRNKYGADAVYIFTGTVMTNDIADIVACSKRIGNTVSIRPKSSDLVQICFW
jgi:hypothetical protein